MATPHRHHHHHHHLNPRLILKGKGEDELDNAYKDVCDYGRMVFWDERYLRETEPFEWYYPYQYFRQTILDNVPLDGKVLVAGCGNSHMIEDMAADGYESLHGLDVSRVVIGQMKIRCSDLPQVTFSQGDMTDVDIPEETYDAVIDKGLMDAIVCRAGGQKQVLKYVSELERITKDDGVFVIISRGLPEERLQFLEQFDLDEPGYTPWFVDVQALLKPEMEGEKLDPENPAHMYWVYVCTKQEDMVKKKRQRAKKKKDPRGEKRVTQKELGTYI